MRTKKWHHNVENRKSYAVDNKTIYMMTLIEKSAKTPTVKSEITANS